VKIKKKKFRILFYVSSISIILILALASNFLILHNMQVEQNVKLKQLSDFIISEKKSYLKNLIYGAIKDIELEKELLIKEKEQGITTFSSNKELQDLLKERAKYKIKNSILPDGSYIWVNKVINYDGGKDYGVRLVHPNLPQTEGMLLSTEMTDITGNFPYKEELEGVKENGEIFFEYYFKKLDTNFISRKLTFAKLYKEFDWIIASGVYLDDVNRLIEDQNAKIKAVYIKQLKFVNAIFLLGIFFAVLITYSFEKKIIRLIDFYNTEIYDKKSDFVSEKKFV